MGPMKGRVLVVDDDAALAEMLGIVLRGEGFEPTFVSDGDKAVEVFRESRPDLVLLDLMLPGSDGIDVCRQIRAESGVPIVMLTAKTDTVDVVLGLESGADDYIVKPFKSKELVARVRARLRRTDEPAPEMLQIGDIVIDVAGHSVKRDGETLNLTPLEFDLLVALARKPRQVFTSEVLLEQVWGYRHAADTRLVNVTAARAGRQRNWVTAFRRSSVGRAIGRRLPVRAKRWLRVGRRWQRSAVAQLKLRWHRSLQLRVVSTTLVLSVLVIAVLGFFLVQSVAAGLLSNAENSADALVRNGRTSAIGQSSVNVLFPAAPTDTTTVVRVAT